MKAKKKSAPSRAGATGGGATKNGIKKRLLRKCVKASNYSATGIAAKRQVGKRAAIKISIGAKKKKNQNGSVSTTEETGKAGGAPPTTPRSRRKGKSNEDGGLVAEDNVVKTIVLGETVASDNNGVVEEEMRIKMKSASKLRSPVVETKSFDGNCGSEKSGDEEGVEMDSETEISNLKMALAENGTAATTVLITPLRDSNVLEGESEVRLNNSSISESPENGKGGDNSKDSRRTSNRQRKPSWRVAVANGNSLMEAPPPVEKRGDGRVNGNGWTGGDKPMSNGVEKVTGLVNGDSKGAEKRIKLETMTVTCGDLTISCRGGGSLPSGIPGLYSPRDLEEEEDREEKRCDFSPQIACDPSTEVADELAVSNNNNNNNMPIVMPTIGEKREEVEKDSEDSNHEQDKENKEDDEEEVVTVTVVSAPVMSVPKEPRVPGILKIKEPVPFVGCCCKESNDEELRLRSGVGSDTEMDSFCQGIDLVNCSKIGCYRVVSSEMNLYRVSRRCQFRLLCQQHAVRLKLHQCCPICGYFCTEGSGVMLCTGSAAGLKNDAGNTVAELNWTSHLFHKKCALVEVLKCSISLLDGFDFDSALENASPEYQEELVSKVICPHCGDKEDIKEISLKFKSTAPVSVPDRPAVLRKFAVAVPRSTTFLNSVEHGTLRFIERTTAAALARANADANLISESLASPGSKKHFLKYLRKNDMARILATIQNNCDGGSEWLINTRFKSLGGQSPLHVAVTNKNICLVHALIIAGANPNATDDNFLTPLMLAVRLDEPTIAKYLIAAGAEKFHVDQNGMTAVHIAAELGNLAVLQGILEDHQDMLNVTDNRGLTALMYAAQNRRTEIVNYLASFWPHQTNVRMVDRDQNTPLHWAAASGATQAVSTLIKYGAEVDAVNNFGRTALHSAVIKGHDGCVLMLLVNRADISISDIEGKTPLDYCNGGAEDELKYKDSLTSLKPSENLSTNQEMIKLCLLQTMTIRSQLSSPSKSMYRVLCRDISLGKERHRRIQCINTIDNATLPENFKYITTRLHSSKSLDPPIMNKDKMLCCSCPKSRTSSSERSEETENHVSVLDSSDCTVCVSDSCECSSHGYDAHERLTIGTSLDENSFVSVPMIQECSELCGCDLRVCANRVVQKGSKCELQIFRSKRKGWGVKSLVKIARGSFVCTYVGEIIDRIEAAQRSITWDDSYIFDLHGGVIFLDATHYGNIARFVNHSCTPNLVAVKVMFDHTDKRYPHIAFFAKTDIEANEEINFDYGPKFWESKIVNGFSCKCESMECKYKTNDESGQSETEDPVMSDSEGNCSDSDHSLV